MSSCISGGGRAYRLEALDLEIIKSPSSNSWISNTSSPSSTISESSNSTLTISTRKPRTPRKRPNQTYNEAAAILSTAYPKIFPAKSPCKFTDSKNLFLFEPSELLMPLQVLDDDRSGFLLDTQMRTALSIEPKGFNPICQSPGEINSSSLEVHDDFQQDIDAESILDEEIGEGIDSIMGNLNVENEPTEDYSNNYNSVQMNSGFCYGYPVGFTFDFGCGMRRELRPMKHVDDGDWWRFRSVNVLDITPKTAKIPAEKKKKKVAEKGIEIKKSEPARESSLPRQQNGDNSAIKAAPSEEPASAPLLLKLNYDDILSAWSDKAPPFPGDAPGSGAAGNDVQARLAQIDLFSENGGIREASVLRYKEKRRSRLFSKKIRYQVRKVNADRRPRMKGRFVRTPNSPDE